MGGSSHEREREMNILAAAVRGGCFFSRTNLIPSKLPSPPSAELQWLRVVELKTNTSLGRSARSRSASSRSLTLLYPLSQRDYPLIPN